VSHQFPHPIVYLITPGEATPSSFDSHRRLILDNIVRAVSAGVTLVQLREKQLTGMQLFELTVDAAAVTRGSRTRLLVNDRFDIAIAAGANGVHLPSDSLPLSVVREKVGPDMIIGVSTHSSQEVAAAAEQGADFAVYGPVFDTPGKGAAKGIGALAEVCREAGGFPVIGLGGIDQSNFRSVIHAGAAGFAAIRSLNDPSSLSAIMQLLRNE
jgi:thiamine-phosphate pyrophosphorylase